MAIHPTAELHPTAVVEDGAEIGAGCRVGAYSVIGPEVALAEGVVVHSHVALAGVTRIGAGTVIFPFASIGHIPQDLKFTGERAELIIGARNRIREHCTMNPGTAGGGGATRVGDDGLFMVGTHVAHDCIVGNHVIMANNATLAGHCVVEDHVILGGLAAVHQHVRLGRGAMIGGLAGVVADVIPYGSVTGERAHLGGPQPRRAEARRGRDARRCTACAPPSPRSSKAKARCRSGCAPPRRGTRRTRW